MILNNESEQKVKGQFYTPYNLVKELIDFCPEYYWKGIILEPTAGDGNIVIGVLNKKLEYMDVVSALHTTIANELDAVEAQKCTERVREWALEHNVETQWKCLNEDAITYKFQNYDYVVGNLPFGNNGNHALPSKIFNNVCKKEACLIHKVMNLNTHYKQLVDYQIKEFPGIVYKVMIGKYNLNYNKGKSVLEDRYGKLMCMTCNHLGTKQDHNCYIDLVTSSNKVLPLVKSNKIRCNTIYLNLNDEEFEKLSKYDTTEFEPYLKEFKQYTVCRSKYIMFEIIRRALDEMGENDEK